MRNTRMILLAGAALAGLAACNALPSEPHPVGANVPYSTNGVVVGFGHEEAAESSASTASDSTAQRGGHGFGSGN